MSAEELVLVVLATFLMATAGVKILALGRGWILWPSGPNLLLFHVSARLAIAAELVAGVLPLVLPWPRVTAGLLAALYAVITVGAQTLHGRECACFGVRGMKVGWAHILGCAGAAVVAAGVALRTVTPAPWSVLGPVWAGAVVVWAGGLLLGGRILQSRVDPSAGGCLERARRLQVFTLADCSACTALKLLSGAAEDPSVDWYVVGEDTLTAQQTAAIQGAQYPSLLAVDALGEPVCPRQEGLPDCQRTLTEFRRRERAVSG
ncbi:MAG: hypothetical protein Q4G45_06465 [Actinomycetia bacterium]|nr:hypothetical protein [Actinomycetes bacterium]